MVLEVTDEKLVVVAVAELVDDVTVVMVLCVLVDDVEDAVDLLEVDDVEVCDVKVPVVLEVLQPSMRA